MLNRGQAGVAHPQCPKVKMFKVLKEVAENTSTGSRGETKLKMGGRVRSASMKELIAKQLKTGLEALDSQALMDLKTGAIKNKKGKKEKSPGQTALGEAKQYAAKLLFRYTICFFPQIKNSISYHIISWIPQSQYKFTFILSPI